MPDVSLLPPNAGPLMRALSLAFAASGELPAVNLADLWDPWLAPADRLPSLAADLGLTFWKPEWPDQKKRHVIARSLEMKRRRGTRASFSTHLGFANASLEQLRAAPQTTTTRASKTADERAAWAAQFPELRVYAYRHRHAGGGLVAGRCWGVSRRAARRSAAPTFAGRRATLVKAGIETTIALRVYEAPSEFVQAHLQAALAASGRRFVAGRPLGRAARSSSASDRLYGFRPGARRLDTLPPQLEPLDIQPTRVAAAAARPAGFVAGSALRGGRRFVRGSRAAERVYDSFRLFDPGKARSTRVRPRGGCFAGRTRLGQPPFELHLDVNVTHRLPGRRPFPFSPRGVVRSHNGQPVSDVLAAVRAAKLGRDRILVRTNLHRPITAGDGIPLDGSFRLGQIVRSL